MDNEILKQYYDLFGEYPFLLTTQSYDSDDYQCLMIMAINRGTPLTEEEINDYFENDYDLVEIEKGNKNEKNPNNIVKNLTEGE